MHIPAGPDQSCTFVAVLDRYFRLSERGTTVLTELRAGVATFLTMAYILLVNPQILADAGMPPDDVARATALASAAATLLMGLWANYPFALAPGMGLNAYFTYGVVQGMGVSYHVALAAVFVEGLLFLALALSGVRGAVLRAIPDALKVATSGGIGLFLAIIGFQNAGLVVDSPATLVTLGSLTHPTTLLALGTLVLMALLLVRRVPGALLLGILAGTLVAWLTGLAPLPERWVQLPGLPRETLASFDFGTLLHAKLVSVVLAFLFVDFFDTAGTLMGIGRLGGFLNARGELERARAAFSADAVGTTLGALLGTSTVTTYIESATGIEEGGRTGLTAVVVALLFLLSLFLAPLFTAVPAAATAPALILVGVFMMQGLTELNWRKYDEAIPAFLTITIMPFTYSIANGIAFGLIAYVLLQVLSGRARAVHPILYVLAVLLSLYYAFELGA
ncbi:Xanthine/uracil/vitamin C permease [Rhodothermus marinus DSM 4252]|uniref:Xanthine/uracil/vitamin C permease n=1 Tax=Rhodothermus marinus (strain ATCC 43812 / DSM 4252 / R-10) TaxID=518766 RepID=D0MGL9_RHOM4|nr:Xanthine/uracil/vitamin C permease [Rhodothermus marinus DSM 4252]